MTDPLPAELCEQLVVASEEVVALHGWSPPSFLRRPISALGLFASGLAQMALTGVAAYITVIGGLLLVSFGVKVGLIEQAVTSNWGYLVLVACVVMFLCPPPSRYARHAQLRTNVECVAKRLPAFDELDADQRKEVASVLDQVRTRTEARLTVLWWLPASLWTFFMFFGQRVVDRHEEAFVPWAFGSVAIAALAAGFLSANRRGASQVFAVAQGVLHRKTQAQAALPAARRWLPKRLRAINSTVSMTPRPSRQRGVR